MSSRRKFLGQVASSLGTLALPGTVAGANDRIRLGIIGYGARGADLAIEATACPHTEIAGVCDIYSAQRDRALQRFPDCKIYADHRLLLEDNSIDAVLIATPQHLHAEHFIGAVLAGRHVYQEKTMAFTVDEAKRMRDAWLPVRGKQVVQIGHQSCSSGHAIDAANFLRNGNLGRITAINAAMYRNTPHGRPQWSRPVYPDMTPENIFWDRFLGSTPEMPFNANRYMNWRLFWDYSGGNVHESMSHQVAFWSKALGLQIPFAVTMTGGVYLWKDGREVPDTMSVSMEQPEELLFTWTSGFGNSNPGITEHVLGTDGSIFRTPLQIRYSPEKMNRPQAETLAGPTATPPRAHMQNFLDCIRSGKEPNCPFEIGYKVSIACRMAIESYLQRRTVYWNSEKEEIV
ncbi:MAG TPA: Gfo/Idh/MocA family oxidoreductase [Bryobacteraceae bacterium]|jgi:predicted dehydrogenase|nr:Gfo/Idh/MocA family oxidoreductase [Bryobacteraceae bacterium]